MDVRHQAAWRTRLAASLEDGRLTRGEASALAGEAASLAGDPDDLAFVRNAAFDLAFQRVAADPEGIVRWLHAVERVLAPRSARRVVHEVAFSPGPGALDLLLRTLRGARRSLDVCVFTITDDRVTAALLDARRRGVEVRVVTDDDKEHDLGSDVARIRETGVAVREDGSPAHMHHKFAIADGVEVLLGSYNWTRGAGGNHEDLLRTDAPSVVARYRARFEELWETFRPRGGA
jgi:mitochondrial cardiolipin hydrolase